jgi:hypothetical protein
MFISHVLEATDPFNLLQPTLPIARLVNVDIHPRLTVTPLWEPSQIIDMVLSHLFAKQIPKWPEAHIFFRYDPQLVLHRRVPIVGQVIE